MEPIDFKKEYLFKGNEIGCLLIHGFTSTPAEIRELGEKLNKEGYTVLGVRLAGHGTTIEDMRKSKYKDWIKSVEDGFEKLNKICEKIYVVGHSMGGVLALNIGEQHKVDKIVLLSPALVIKDKNSRYAGIAKYFKKYIEWDPIERPVEETKYLLGYGGVPLASVEQLSNLQRVTRKALGKIDSPLLIISSIKDNTIDEIGIRLIEEGVSSKDVKKVSLNNCGHNITVECEKETVFSEVIEFLKN